ncbi:MAG: S41 family peptidase [Peptococcaceae bacterium]|nr:S41 family peptidase [Peptococcaceae bacterium]
MPGKKFKRAILALVVSSVLVNSLVGAVLITNYQHLGSLVKVVLLVRGLALPQVTWGKMLDGATGGIVASLQDEHSLYPAPANYPQAARQIENSVMAKIIYIPQKVGYIKINSFTARTEQDLAMVWPTVTHAEGLILDLRDNPGGSLSAAVGVANYFLPPGPAVQLVYGNGKRESYPVQGKGLKLPVVVLVNHKTAREAEVLAAAEQDKGTSLLVGTTTRGIGVRQTVYQIDAKTSLQLATAKYLSPLGRGIDTVGIEPDVSVAAESEILDAGLKVLAAAL